jgi:hypothetical protein
MAETTAPAAPAAAQTQTSTIPSPAEVANMPAEAAAPVAANAKEVLADPNATQAQKVQAKKTLNSLKIKFNGKEYEEKLPFEIPDNEEARTYMQNKLQMDRLARVKSQESADQQKMMQQFFADLKKDPRRVLSDPNVGVDLKKIAVQMIEEEIENSKKSPDQLEKEKLQRELQQMKEDRDREKDAFNKRELERLQEQEFERYDMLITKAIEKTDLPKSPYIVKKMADYMLMGLENNIDVTPDDVLPLVREEMQNDLKEMFSAMPEDVIESIVGKDVINRIRKKNLQRAKAGNSTAATQIANAKVKDTGNSKPAEKAPAAKKKYSEFFGV